MSQFFKKKRPYHVALSLALLVTAMTTGLVWLVAAAQTESNVFVPMVSNSSSTEDNELVFDMSAESSEEWTQIENVLANQELAAEHQPGHVTILLNGRNRNQGAVDITCVGDGCGGQAAQNLSAQSTQDLEITLLLRRGRKLVLTQSVTTQLRIVVWQDNTIVNRIVFVCTSPDCLIQVTIDDRGRISTPTPTSTQPSPNSPATPTPTNTRTSPNPTATPTATSEHNHDDADLHWHPPGAHGDRPAHEHGDAPPQWVLDAGYDPSFTHVAGTPNENHFYWKHTGFKGYAGNFQGVDWYGIFHLDFNPGGHPSRFHSYQLWLRDGTGAVSHMHGWLDFGQGNNTGPNLVTSCEDGHDIRPIMAVIGQGCDVQANFESWYSRTYPAWGADFGFNIATSYYTGGDPADPATWTPINGSVRNLDRRIEFSWYASRSNLRGDFWTTQFGDVVSGPNDALCGTQRSYGEKSYTIVCLQQTIQPTLTTIGFPGNSVQRMFPGKDVVRLPN